MAHASYILISVVASCLLVVSSVTLTWFVLAQFYDCQAPAHIPKPHTMDYLDRFHNPETRTTAIKSVAARKCYIVTNDEEAISAESRAMHIVSKPLCEKSQVALFGQEIADFCEGCETFPTQIVTDNSLSRKKRQTAEDQIVEPEANECQDNILVDCGSGQAGVYDCVTGPGAVYKAKTQCKSETQFTFELTNRCDEFPATEKLRFIKCLQYFIDGKHLEIKL